MFYKRIAIFLLLFSTISIFAFSPILKPAEKAHAFWGVGDINVESVPQLLDYVSEKVGTTIAQKMIDDMVKSTIEWAQTGFEGNPGYITDFKGFLAKTADGVAGEFIAGTDLSALCSPFQAQIRIALQRAYVGNPQPYQCTLTGIVGNIDAFFDDFEQGGWDGWFALTQNDVNNPYGAFLRAQADLDSRIATALHVEQTQLNWNQGFLSWADCAFEDPFTGECLARGSVQTPGSTIKSQLDKVLPSGLEKLITADSIDELVSAFANGLLTKYVFGPDGLFAEETGRTQNVTSRVAHVDFDGDSVPDGRDLDYDGALNSSVDVCFHGGVAPNCNGSATTENSPYFTPICQATNNAIIVISDFIKFIQTYRDEHMSDEDNFRNEEDAQVWGTRSDEALSAAESLLSSITSYRSSYFDDLEVAVNRYANFMNRVTGSLLADGGDLDLARVGNGGGGYPALFSANINIVAYLLEVQSSFGNCVSPNITGIPEIPLPPPPVEGGGGGGGQCVLPPNQYEGDLLDAMDAVLEANPEIGDLPNIESNDRENARIFLALVVEELRSRGFNATDDVLNGNSNPNTGDLIALWQPGDNAMERYDAISGSASTIREAAMADFIGLVSFDCVEGGGATDCRGCTETEGGGGTEPPPPGSGGGGTGTPFISSVSPTSVARGSLLTINGTDLTSTVQFFDSSGNRYTHVGNVNSNGTVTTIVVPTEVPLGTTRVRIYRAADRVSNEVTIQITAGANPIATTEPTSTWSPTQTINNWWPELSPDGRYVTYGNWGESWVTDSVTKETWNFSTPPGLPEPSICIAGHWMSSTVMTFVCEATATDTRHYRYEVTVGDWTPVITADTPTTVAGNWFRAADGHWVSLLAAGGRLSRDNEVIATGVGRALSVDGNNTVHLCNSTETTICVRTGNTISKTYTRQVPVYQTTITNGYIMYGGFGPVRGITPSGADVNLRLSSTLTEFVGKIVFVNSTPWVVTIGERADGTYIFLRPWGTFSAIAVSADHATQVSVAVVGSDFLIAYSTDVGRMSLITVPVNSPRTTIN